MDALPGVPGVSKNQIYLQIKLLSFCTRIAPKKAQTSKNRQNISEILLESQKLELEAIFPWFDYQLDHTLSLNVLWNQGSRRETCLPWQICMEKQQRILQLCSIFFKPTKRTRPMNASLIMPMHSATTNAHCFKRV